MKESNESHQPATIQPRKTRRGDALWRLMKKGPARVGVVLCLIVVLTAVLAPVVAPYDPLEINVYDRLQKPSREHWFGTDELGRDVLSRIVYGTRISLMVGTISIAIALLIGTPLGLQSAFYGGTIDGITMRTMDALAAFPAILMALAIVSVLGPSVRNSMIAIGISFLPAFSRLTRGNVLSVKENQYVEAAHASGAPSPYIMFRTILPNCLAPVLVHVSIGFANAIIIEAGLSFLGLGAQPPTPSWGAMLQEGRQFMNQNIWYSISAGMAIFFTVLGVNLLGDGLRDVLDPQLRGR